MTNDKNKNTLILASLLHDIGKPLTWAHFDKEERNHAELSARIIDHCLLGKEDKTFKEYKIPSGTLHLTEVSVDDSRLLVLNHHGDISKCDIPLLNILRNSDHIAASERDAEDSGFNKIQLMENPFSRLFEFNKPTYFQPDFLTKDHMLDSLKSSENDAVPSDKIRSRCKELLNDLVALSNSTVSKNISFETYLSWLELTLYKHLWMWPSSRRYQERRDISLYDHIRFTTGLATSLYLNNLISTNNNDMPFKFIIGDFSGIQNYIFNISGSKAAKRLRAKSFWVQTLQENLIFNILKEFTLNRSNIISNTGGKFILLCPSTINESDFRAITSRIINSVYHEYKAEIAISLALSKAYSKEVFSSQEDKWGTVLKEINVFIQQEKLKPHQLSLQESGKWKSFNHIFALAENVKTCDSCEQPQELIFNKQNNENKCKTCEMLEELGRKLVKPRPVFHYANDKGIPFNVNPTQANYSLIINPSFVKNEEERWRIAPKSPLVLKFMANHIPVNEQLELLDFEDIAEKSGSQVKMMAVLKADVDNLGALFRNGLTKANTPSRFMTISRLLDLFFSGYLDSFVEKNYGNCYFVYAGGDDLLMVGPWTDIFDFALKLHEEFFKFTNHNPQITLSAGISLFKPKQPILTAVLNADNELSLAKKIENKNSLSFWGKAMTWNNYKNIIKPTMESLSNWFNDEDISTQFGRHLLTFSRMIETGSIRWKPLLAYQMSRNLDKAPTQFKDWCRQLLEEDQNEEMKLVREHLTQIVQYALYKVRKKTAEAEE